MIKRASFSFWAGAVFALLVLLLAGCGGAPAGKPGLKVGLNPSQLTITQGQSGTTTLTITPQNGFSGTVTLALEKQDGSAAAGFTLSPTSVAVSGGAKTQTLTISVASSVTAGTYQLKVVGTSGKVSASANLTVKVQAAVPPSFTLGLDPTELTVTQGQSGTTTLTITPQNGFSGTVTLALEKQDGSAAAGFTLSPTSVAVSGGAKTQTLTIAVASSVEVQSYQLKVVGTSGSLAAEASLAVNVEAPPPQAGDVWTVLSAELFDVAYGNGVYVAVGADGAIFTSADGASWTFRSLGENKTSYPLSAVAYGGGRFVAVGKYGTVFTSADGSEWDPQDAGSTAWLRGVAYGEPGGSGVYVAVGANGTILYSSDAATWHAATVPEGTTGQLNGVAYDGTGVFVAAGASGTVLVSNDGVSWQAPQNPPETGDDFVGVTFGGGQFVAVGSDTSVATSDDGETWNVSESAPPASVAVTYGEPNGSGVYVVVNWYGKVYTSEDGTSWLEAAQPAANLKGVGYGAQGFVAVGGGIYTSASGQSWSQALPGTIYDFLDVIYAGGRFVAVGKIGTVFTSTDGLSWTAHSGPNNSDLHGVAYGDGRYVAVGGGGTTAYSSDGSDWQQGGTVDGELEDVTYGQKPGGTGIFVAVGWQYDSSSGTDQPKVYYSADGSSWTPASQPPTATDNLELRGVACGQKPDGTDLFVAVGGNGAVFTSPDGDRWTEASSGTSNRLYGVVYAGGRFVAVGMWDTVIASTDGENWSPFNSGVSGSFNGVGYGGGRYVAVGGSGALFTKDGDADWARRDSGIEAWLTGVAYGQDRFVVVGGHGVILVSPAP